MVLESNTPQAVRQRRIAAITLQTAQDMGVDFKEFAEPVAVAAARANIPMEFRRGSDLHTDNQLKGHGRTNADAFVKHGADDAKGSLAPQRVGTPHPSPAATPSPQGEGNVRGQEGTVPSGQYSVAQVVGDSGKNYGIGVKLDSDLLTGLSDAERIQMVKLWVVEELAGKSFVAYDGNTPVEISIVNNNEKIINENGKKYRVLEELYRKNIYRKIKQEAVVLADELIEASKYDEPSKAKHKHDWLDNDGKNLWDSRTVHIQDKSNAVWEATLHIANSTDGRKILYDISPIKMVEEAGKSASTTTNNSITENGENVNTESPVPAAVMEGTDKDGNIFFGAMYDREGGKILLNADAIKDGRITVGQSLDFFLKHELTHKIERAGAWDTLAKLARKDMGAEAFDAQVQAVQQRRAADGDTVGSTPEGAKKEVVADWVGTNLFKKEFAAVMAKEYKGFANNLVLTFSGLRRGLAATEKGRQAARMKYAEQLYLKALAESAPDVTDEQIAARLEEILGRMAEDGQPTAEDADAAGVTPSGAEASAPPSDFAASERRVEGGEETVQTGQYAIVELENGKKYVKADTQVISGTDTTKWASQVSGYINRVLRNGNDLSITADNGDVLTLTKDSAYKGGTRNTIKMPDGTYRDMTNEEYATKLNAEVHIHELAEVSTINNKNPTPDRKNHPFAKDGFVYRTAFFEDFDGQYYRVTISVGLNGNVSTIYNVGRIKKDTMPYGKIKTIQTGSKANGIVSNTTVPQNADGVNSQSVQNGGENSPTSGQRAQMTPEIAAQLQKNQAEIDERNRRRGIQRADAQAEIDAVVDSDVDTDTDEEVEVDNEFDLSTPEGLRAQADEYGKQDARDAA